MKNEKLRQCHGCKIVLPYSDYPADNRYGVHSPECRALFDEILVKEGQHFGYPPVHRLIIDSYWVQHPPHRETQINLGIEKRFIAASIQSIAIHLIALYAAIEEKIELKSIAPLMDKILTTMKSRSIEFEELQAPQELGYIKAYDINMAFKDGLSLGQYEVLAWQWAHSSWQAWAKHHGIIKKWYEKFEC